MRNRDQIAQDMMEYLERNREIIILTTRMEVLLDEWRNSADLVDNTGRPVTPGRKEWVKK